MVSAADSLWRVPLHARREEKCRAIIHATHGVSLRVILLSLGSLWHAPYAVTFYSLK